jgi:hypothetical protein
MPADPTELAATIRRLKTVSSTNPVIISDGPAPLGWFHITGDSGTAAWLRHNAEAIATALEQGEAAERVIQTRRGSVAAVGSPAYEEWFWRHNAALAAYDALTSRVALGGEA